MELLLEGHIECTANTPERACSALKSWFKQFPHRVRDDKGVVENTVRSGWQLNH
ncbi:hypothetical protein [Pseudoalteromonas sp. R3]|uniref:hypothetical protein n=1 Tax=Pseudoalteromonas sp. R3 TaxID=1709477 RepID=UPI000A7F746C|nr:hypothetical protein [Pseudoalteromonas sp. R3]